MTVTVEVSNSYECGRQSEATEVVPAPSPGAGPGTAELEAWFDEVVHDLTGDGHPCGSIEHAYYEATIVAAPGQEDLVGATHGWEG